MDIEDQKQEIEDLKQQVYSQSGSSDMALKARVAQLENENKELRLYLAALVRYLGRRGVLQQDEFRALVVTVDAEDGSKDGGYTGKIVK